MNRRLVVAGLAVSASIIVFLAGLSWKAGSASASSTTGGHVEQRIVVIETNLLVPGNSTVTTSSIDLDGFARWGFQVTVRSGLFPFDLSWRPSYRMRGDLDFTTGLNAPFASDRIICGLPGGCGGPVEMHAVSAPEAVIEIRNDSSTDYRVAISGIMHRRQNQVDGDPYRSFFAIADTEVLVSDEVIQLAPGESGFSEPFHVGSAHAVRLQIGNASGQIAVEPEWKIFNQQDFVPFSSNQIFGVRSGISHAIETVAPWLRVKVTNNSGSVFEFQPAVYALTFD